MELAQRFGTPSTRLISLMKSFEYPFLEVKEGDRIAILTDDAMDPLIWQTALAWIQTRGAEGLVCLYPRRAYHCADPVSLAVAAAKQADVCIALTTTCLN